MTSRGVYLARSEASRGIKSSTQATQHTCRPVLQRYNGRNPFVLPA
jgi:hypothetical protein